MIDLEAAIAYAEKHESQAFVAARNGSVVVERYGSSFHGGTPHALYSGTKSFWGIAAMEAVREGLFALDDPVCDVLRELAGDARRRITPRMLLSMTAGYGFGGLGSAVPPYDRALDIPLKAPPGMVFTYGGIPLQIFGAFLARLLQPRGMTPHDYLRENVLEPAGTTISSWKTLSDGTNPLPTGAQLTARAWLSFGNYVLAHRDRFRETLVPGEAHPRYGLGWWLSGEAFYASGSGGQGLYILPSDGLAIVRYGKSASYKHDALLKRLGVSASAKARVPATTAPPSRSRSSTRR